MFFRRKINLAANMKLILTNMTYTSTQKCEIVQVKLGHFQIVCTLNEMDSLVCWDIFQLDHFKKCHYNFFTLKWGKSKQVVWT